MAGSRAVVTSWRAPTRHVSIVVGIVIAYIVLAVALAKTRPPLTDEGVFANASALFITEGYLGWPMWTGWATDIEHYLFATMPLYFLTLAGWFHLFGIGFPAMRLFSVLWGVIALASWYLSVQKITSHRVTQILAVLFVGLNYDFINLTTARYDPMVAGLNAAAIAAYLQLRETRLTLAVVIAHTLLAAACMTHPYGAFGIAGVVIFAAMLDRQRIHWRHVALAAIPYVVALVAWGWYITRDLDAFYAQMAVNSQGRLDMLATPLRALYSEITVRYIQLAGGWRPGVPIYMRAKILVLVLYAVAQIACWSNAQIRRNAHQRALLVYTIVAFLLLTFFEGNRWYVYTIHIWPLFAIALALWSGVLWETSAARRRLVTAGVLALTLFAIVTVAYRVKLDVFSRSYLPALQYIQSRIGERDLVIAAGQFGVGLDFAKHVIDDPEMTKTRGRQADFIVIGREYRDVYDQMRRDRPHAYAAIEAILADRYEVVFRSGSGADDYDVYARRVGESAGR